MILKHMKTIEIKKKKRKTLKKIAAGKRDDY